MIDFPTYLIRHTYYLNVGKSYLFDTHRVLSAGFVAKGIETGMEKYDIVRLSQNGLIKLNLWFIFHRLS